MPPAVTSTRTPARLRALASRASTTSAISAGSDIRPTPTSPSAVSPWPGPTSSTPRAASRRRFSVVAPACHMRGFIAGAATIGPAKASAVAVRTFAASPWAMRESVVAESGAMQ